MKLRIRQGTVLDAAETARVRALAWAQTYGGMFPDSFIAEQGSPEGLAANTRFWEETIGDGGYLWLVVDDDTSGEIVGFSHAAPARDEDSPTLLELRVLYLLRRAQGSGVADALLQHTIGDADCMLWVVEANERAKRFYARHGFAPDGRQHIYHEALESRLVRIAADED